MCPLPSPRPSCRSTSRIPARLSWCTSSSDLWTWCLGLGEAGTWGLAGDWEKQVPTLGSWLGLASTLRAADTVGQPVALPGIEGLGDEGRGVGEGGIGQQPPLSPAVPPRSSALAVARTSLALCPGPCCPATLWASCVATWSPRRWHCGNPWGRPGHAPGRAAARGTPGWGPERGWLGQRAQLTPGPSAPALSGHGSRRRPHTCPGSTVAGSHPWTCCRTPPGRWRGWQLPATRSELLQPLPTPPLPSAHCPPSWLSPCRTPNLGACFPTAGSGEPTVL